ncbi:hypothetical protein P8605_48400, partial [Streptomyces sp. T-3]|nr:hypothetical protein [Streptomyces sp. T-3]
PPPAEAASPGFEPPTHGPPAYGPRASEPPTYEPIAYDPYDTGGTPAYDPYGADSTNGTGNTPLYDSLADTGPLPTAPGDTAPFQPPTAGEPWSTHSATGGRR